jgi:HAD superfamily hydrolase (TIGR01509 family)
VIFLNIKAAIFDMDGTLVDSLMLWDVLWSTFGKQYLDDDNFAPSVEDDKKVRTLTLRDAMKLIHSNYNLGESGEELLAVANRIMNDFYANRVELKDGVREFLEHCKNNGIKMCIASATAPELIDVALKHCDIGKYFLKVFSCGAIGKGKDKPDVFLQAANFLGTEVRDTWVFEDSLVAIETATKIGMPTVGIYDRFNYGQDKIKEIAKEYINSTETLLKLIY